MTGDWKGHFSQVTQLRLHHLASDHWPVLLDSEGINRGPSPFRFENMWLLSEGFGERVRGWCCSYTMLGNPSCHSAQKLNFSSRICESGIRRCLGNCRLKRQIFYSIAGFG